MDLDSLKTAACDEIDRLGPQLIEISHEIHANPELKYEERFAHGLLTGVLAEAGLEPQRSAYGIETAFRADAGATGAPTMAVMCEYDALPQIGHACGHNIIAAAGLGAGLVLASLVDQVSGRVSIIGTPAEEGGGGKILLARAGALDDLDAAMMIHPADADLVHMDVIAVETLNVVYEGRAAHAAAAPWDGRNALDAAVLGYMGVAALRQHIRPDERVHGIFVEGGDKPNIVPKHTSMEWYVRSPKLASLEPLKERVVAALAAGASACGCSMTHEFDGRAYSDMLDNGPLVASYVANARRLGRDVVDPSAAGKHVVGSTDMGNVSYVVPSIHPMIKVAADGVPIHTQEFAEWAESPDGDRAVLDGAKAMAMTTLDWYADANLRAAAADAFAAASHAA
jgi:amidohydrolase